MDWNHLCNIGRRHHESQSCEIILNLDQWFGRKCHLKVFLIWSSGRHFVQRNVINLTSLVEGIQRDNSVKLFKIWVIDSGAEVVLKISYLELWSPFCSAERNHLCNFGKGYQKEQFSEIILNLGK